MNISTNTGSIDEWLIQVWFLGLGIGFALAWPLRSRILLIFMLLGRSEARVIHIGNTRNLQSGVFWAYKHVW